MKKFLINLTMMSVSIVVSIIVIEVVLKFTDKRFIVAPNYFSEPYFMGHDSNGYDIRPNIKKFYGYKPEDKLEYEVWSNEIGCFDHSFNIGKDEDYILLVGDSFTHGATAFDKKWGTVVEEKIGTRLAKCGVSGYGTRQELTKAKETISKIKKNPKLIIVGYFMNDVLDDYKYPNNDGSTGYLINNSLFDQKTGELTKRSQEEKNIQFENWKNYCIPEQPKRKLIKKAQCFLTRNSIIYNLVKEPLKKLLKSHLEKNNLIVKEEVASEGKEIPYADISFIPEEKYPYLKTAWDNNFSNIKDFKAFADSIGSKLLFVIIPRKQQVYREQFDDHNYDHDRPNKKLSSMFYANGIRFFDLLPDFREYSKIYSNFKAGEGLYWSHDSHWNERGNVLAGLLVSKFLVDSDLLPLEKAIPNDINKNLEDIKNKRLF